LNEELMTAPATVEPRPKPANSMPAGVDRIAQCTVEGGLCGVSVSTLASLRHSPESEAMQVIEHPCSRGCGTMLQTARFFAPLTCCEECKAKADKADKIEKARTYWEAICPKSFRETDKTHADFPKAQYTSTRGWQGGESLFFYGPSGKGKTRLAMWLLKRCLVKHNSHVSILWSYDLKAVKNERDMKAWVQKWGKYDVLLMDDPLQGAADGRVTDALKDLLAYRMDWKRPNIVTSQVGGADAEEQLAKFGKETKADKELLAALLRRLRETCRVVSFAEAKPQDGERPF
jgi:DNA replication protein DnaC